MPNETNGLLLTGSNSLKLEDEDFIASLKQEIQQITTDINQFIVLKPFKRILIIFKDPETSSLVFNNFNNQTNDFKVRYTKINYDQDPNNRVYLKLPQGPKLFLVTPPPSPPPEFNFDEIEEEPNKIQSYTSEDLHDIFWRNHKDLKEIVDTHEQGLKYPKKVVKELENFGKEIIINDPNGDPLIPKITFYPVEGDPDSLTNETIMKFKTSLPPMSAFDGLSDSEYDEYDEFDE